MIRYALICTNTDAKGPRAPRGGKRAAAGCGHEFESWFQNGEAFDKLLARRQIVCPACGSTAIAKGLMAPSVKTTKGKDLVPARRARPDAPEPAAEPSASVPLATLTPEQRAFVETMRKVKAHVLANSEYVGPKFADEARKIHHEETPARGIHGEATLEEAKALAEEGIDVLPLPVLPDDRN